MRPRVFTLTSLLLRHYESTNGWRRCGYDALRRAVTSTVLYHSCPNPSKYHWGAHFFSDLGFGVVINKFLNTDFKYGIHFLGTGFYATAHHIS